MLEGLRYQIRFYSNPRDAFWVKQSGVETLKTNSLIFPFVAACKKMITYRAAFEKL